VGAAPLTAESATQVPGTLPYYSPELCQAILRQWDTGEVLPFKFEPAGDLHALGVIFYQVLTGEHPFDEEAPDDELFRQIATEIPDRPSVLNPEVPFGLEKITMRLLQKDPELRYGSGDDVAEDLQALLKTRADWSQQFQTPAKSRHAASSPAYPSSSWRDSARIESKPGAAEGVEAPSLEPSAIVLFQPQAPAENEDALAQASAPRGRPLVPRRFALPLAAVLALVQAFVMIWLIPRQHGAAAWYLEGGTMAFGKARAAVVTVVSSAVSACALLLGHVRPGDKDFLAQCSPEARKPITELNLETDTGLGEILDGPNVIVPFGGGVELRDGPVEVSAAISTPVRAVIGVLHGTIRTGSDGASLRFNKFKLYNGSEGEDDPPAGPEIDVCAVASVRGAGSNYGIPKADDPPPASELHQGYVFVTTGALHIHFAH